MRRLADLELVVDALFSECGKGWTEAQWAQPAGERGTDGVFAVFSQLMAGGAEAQLDVARMPIGCPPARHHPLSIPRRDSRPPSFLRLPPASGSPPSLSESLRTVWLGRFCAQAVAPRSVAALPVAAVPPATGPANPSRSAADLALQCVQSFPKWLPCTSCGVV